MPSLFGPKRSFPSQRAAEDFIRHLTRELTAGGVAHWVELREDATAKRWTPVLHRARCPGGAACSCNE